jgi:hypothetical protein
MRTIAVDWSGARLRAENKIWLAEVVGGRLVRLENGRTREQVAGFLVAEAERDPDVVVGFDFAFSLPAWFLQERGLERVQDLWALAERDAEHWLAECETPFWGRPGRRRPDLGRGRDHFRLTDTSVPDTGGIRPKSVFQIGGAGAVGTGSLRGMPILHRLSAEGFSVWPFGSTDMPLVVEIYPRILTGAVNKSSATERTYYLSRFQEKLPQELRERAASSEDAFDAAVSALVMSISFENQVDLTVPEDRRTMLEGKIWHPGVAREEPKEPEHQL